jgi:hypothetical protein
MQLLRVKKHQIPTIWLVHIFTRKNAIVTRNNYVVMAVTAYNSADDGNYDTIHQRAYTGLYRCTYSWVQTQKCCVWNMLHGLRQARVWWLDRKNACKMSEKYACGVLRICDGARNYRLIKESDWIKRLQTEIPCGLNKKCSLGFL